MEAEGIDKILDKAIERVRTGDQPEQAIALLLRAVDMDPRSFTARYWLGVARSRCEQWQNAVRDFESALKLGESAELWRYYGLAQIELGEFDEGRHALKRASSLSDDKAPLFDLACAFEREGRKREAFNAVTEYLKHEQDDPLGWEFLEVLSRATGAGKDPMGSLESRELAEFQDFKARYCDQAMATLLESRRRLLDDGDGFPLAPVDAQGEAVDLKQAFSQRLGRFLLGSADDDGVSVPPYNKCRLGVDHLAVTFARLIGLFDIFELRPGRVLALDGPSTTLARLLAELLGVSLFEATDLAGAEEEALASGLPSVIFQAQGKDFLSFERSARSLGSPHVSFVLFVGWVEQGLTFEARHLPDVTGVLGAEVTLPEPEELTSEAFLGFLHGAVRKHLARERERQVDYYAGRREAFIFSGLPREK